jgi:hypothetical protein
MNAVAQKAMALISSDRFMSFLPPITTRFSHQYLALILGAKYHQQPDQRLPGLAGTDALRNITYPPIL